MPDEPDWCDDLGPAFRAAIRASERRGWMTFRELDATLPDGDYTSGRIEDILAYLRRKGIEVVEDDEPDAR